MLSTIVAILAVLAGFAAIVGAIWQFWEPLTKWMTWAQDFAVGLFDFLPDFLAPFAGIMIILALVGLGVKIL